MASTKSLSGGIPWGREPSSKLDTNPELCSSDMMFDTPNGNDIGDVCNGWPVEVLTDKLLEEFADRGEDGDSLISFEDPLRESRPSSPIPFPDSALQDSGSDLEGKTSPRPVEWEQNGGRCVTIETPEHVPQSPRQSTKTPSSDYPWLRVQIGPPRNRRLWKLHVPKRSVAFRNKLAGKRKKRLVCYPAPLLVGSHRRDTRRCRRSFRSIPDQKCFARDQMIHDISQGIAKSGGEILPVDSKSLRPTRIPRRMTKLPAKGTVSFRSQYTTRQRAVAVSPAANEHKVYLTPDGFVSEKNPFFPKYRSKKTLSVIRISKCTNLMMKRNPQEPPRMATISFRGFITTKGKADDYISRHCNENREIPIKSIVDLPTPPGTEVALASSCLSCRSVSGSSSLYIISPPP